MTLVGIAQAAGAEALAIRGVLSPAPDPCLPTDTKSLVLLGPDEPAFWPHFQAAPEARDGRDDPLDRWSVRVISDIAARFDGAALFPSDGPPFPPFIRWALDSHAAWQSPVGLLVHHAAGLFISYRGAIALPIALAPEAHANPCRTCEFQPCKEACPVGALGEGQPYDTTACQRHLASAAGQDCREGGCLVRRACPVARGFTRLPEQSAFHTRAFMRNARP